MIPALLPAYLLVVSFGLSLACLVTLFTPQLSTWVPALTTYGKAAFDFSDQPRLLKLIAVPKRWFAHFYIIAVLNTTSWLIHAFFLTIGIGHHPLPSVVYLLKFLTLAAVPSITWTTSIVALSLIFIHVFRRCYESLFVSVYSDSCMNIGHYVMGMVHYLILPLTVVCEAHGFMDNRMESISVLTLTARQWLGILLFAYCNVQQHSVVKKMAKVRKTPDGLTSHYNHGIFYGGWFNVVSCPHFLFEIGIYFAFWLVLLNANAYMYMLIFVIINQTFAAEINHRWYKKTFAKYPKDRYAIIPYIM